MDRLQLTRLRQAALGLVGAGIAAAALRVALRGLDWPALQEQFRRTGWAWLAAAVLFDSASYMAQGWRWRLLLGRGSVWKATRAIYAGLFMNELIPMRPGEAVRAWLAARDLGMGLGSVAPTMVAERLMDGLWLAAALGGAMAVAPLPGSLVRMARWAAGLILAALLGIWLLGGTRCEPLRRARRGLGNWRALLVSGGFLLAQGLAFWAVIRASHLGLGLMAAFVVMVVVRTGTLIPGAPANLGTHQLSTVLGLSLYGVAQPEAAAFAVVVFTALTAPLLAIGLCAWLSAGVEWRAIRR